MPTDALEDLMHQKAHAQKSRAKARRSKHHRGGVPPEPADAPVLRTAWSTRLVPHNEFMGPWERCHATLVNDARAYRATGRPQIALLGDSITESWRGTGLCRKLGRCQGVPGVLQATLGARWPQPTVLGIAADHTQHLLWRLADGELSPAMASDPQLAFVVLIGTNNLGRGHTPKETVAGVVAVAGTLLNQTQGRVLLNALLPRGDGNKRKKAAPVVGSAADGSPVRSFSPLITKVNAGLRSWAEADTFRRVGTRGISFFAP
uniref:SGNH hydrolase-type esterase domain-containing protein n=1 Tax=Emiliania huxleyi TaxID=2903 RepID=A0A7S3S1M9_EMIHU